MHKGLSSVYSQAITHVSYENSGTDTCHSNWAVGELHR